MRRRIYLEKFDISQQMAPNHRVEIEPFDPSKCTWSRWVERLETAFELLEATEESKQKLLLHYMGQQTYNILCDKLAPVKATTKAYAEIETLLKEHFDPAPLEIVENYKFHLRKQMEGEKVAEFLVALRRMSIHCNFGAYLETALRNQFVFGIRNQKVQNRMLETKILTLKRAEEIATAMEMSERGGAEMHHQLPKVEAVNLVNQRSRRRKGGDNRKSNNGNSGNSHSNSGNHDKGANANVPKCYRCGGTNHLADKCRYRKSLCNQCGTVGHLARACQKSIASSSKATNNITMIEDLSHIGDKSIDKLNVDLIVNNRSISFEIDTGAPVTIVGVSDAKKWFPKLQVFPTDRRLASYCGNEIKVFGYVNVDVQMGTESTRLKLYVVNSLKPPLLGREWLSTVRLDWPKIFGQEAVNAIAAIARCDSSATQQTLNSLISEHSRLFDGKMGCMSGIEAKMQLKVNATPTFLKSRRLPFALKEAVERELAELTAQGVLEKVDTSEWATPIVPVKKGNKVRICGDYKITVNPQLLVEEHPLPTIDELYSSMAGGDKYTKIDLSTAYLQMKVRQSDRELLTLSTHRGLYRPTRLMYGIASAPAKFQREMENLLADIDGVSVFIDDIKVTARNDEEHLSRLKEVFKRLNKLNMRVNLNKCEFMVNVIEYCGYRIDRNGIHKCVNKVEAITKMPAPSSVEEVRTFSGMVNFYGRFIENLSGLMHPLYELLKSDGEFKWDKKCQSAFEKVKAEMQSEKVLCHFDPSLPVILATDASPVGVGATLSHRYPDGSERPIQHASQSLSEVQRKYSQIDKEAYAAIFGVKKFHQFLYGRKFTLILDNKPIMQIFSPQKGLPTLTATRMQHYAIFLEAYEFNTEYRKSADHANVDALSRLPVADCIAHVEEVFELFAVDEFPVTAEQLEQATAADTEIAALLSALKTGRHCDSKHRHNIPQTEFNLQNGAIVRGIRAYIPGPLRQRILEELHTSHFGMSRMKALARAYVWWPKLDADIDSLVMNCELCQQQRANPSRESTHVWESAKAPMERVHVDYAGPFLGKYFFILVDAYTKWPEIHIVSSITAEVTIDVCRKIFSCFGIPSKLVSDRGPQFTSAEFQQFLKSNGIEHAVGAPYHPATNGQAERYVRTFKDKLKTLKCRASDLSKELSCFLLSYRRTTHPATGRSPAMGMFNRQVKSRLDLLFAVQRKSPTKTTSRSFNRGERVGVREYLSVEKWQFGQIVQKFGLLHYDVLLDDGRTWRRHVDQIVRIGDQVRSTPEVDFQPSTSAATISTQPPPTASISESTTQSATAVPSVRDSPSTTHHSSTIVTGTPTNTPRKSQRSRQPIDRYRPE